MTTRPCVETWSAPLFFIRRAKIEDVGTLLKLAKMVHFINLPADKDIISSKIINSRNSFQRAAGRQDAPQEVPVPRHNPGDDGLGIVTSRSELFMFVLDDTENPTCLGTSQLVSQMGGPGHPNVCFKLERRERFSETLKSGMTNVVARLHLDESGPTEIGGLILQPSFRGHPLKLGRLLSLVRFHMVGLHRNRFRDRILAEMMAPITPDGHNLLWDYLGRRFIPLSYSEADKFCQYSKEFMTALLPQGDIHLSLLPPEARSVVGKVGPETVPARRMLEKLGFEYRDFVDPFDGGPFLEAPTDSISLVRDTHRATLGPAAAKSRCRRHGIISVLDGDGEFRAVEQPYTIDAKGRLCTTQEALEVLDAEPGAAAGVTPLNGRAGPKDSKRAADGTVKKAPARGKAGKTKP